ncbi:hypothetical protein ONA91_05945 [Micromonospora sp. DR5-3]|uniref:glycoside hydrolase family 78 protein n=1 Tax=unclassified Micromonospora TaxID=2617518 RepID=UPI0011D46239|nr:MULTISPECIES: hypothetical protein [unclassified Micromonospora]MCW3813996.1 hypothetical protein [Micromonospora sp. DR5-3]TYC23646.1 hypothetical protein FXF52_14880 [Micromonospora sp. MP36]
MQSARQIQVATAADRFDEPDVWDSGRVTSRDSVNVRYPGPDLRARTRYFWRVRVWDGAGMLSDWSKPAWFETALPAGDLRQPDRGYGFGPDHVGLAVVAL